MRRHVRNFLVSLLTVAAITGPAHAAPPDADVRAIGHCYLSPMAEQIKPELIPQGFYGFSPWLWIQGFYFEKGPPPIDVENAEAEILQEPSHGRLKYFPASGKYIAFYSYIPDNGYSGKDTAIFLLTDKAGEKFKVVARIKVSRLYDLHTYPKVDRYRKYCPKNNPWPISNLPQ